MICCADSKLTLSVSKEASRAQATSEVERTLKCEGENRDPYILLRVVCAHMVCAPQYNIR